MAKIFGFFAKLSFNLFHEKMRNFSKQGNSKILQKMQKFWEKNNAQISYAKIFWVVMAIKSFTDIHHYEKFSKGATSISCKSIFVSLMRVALSRILTHSSTSCTVEISWVNLWLVRLESWLFLNISLYKIIFSFPEICDDYTFNTDNYIF